MRIQNLGPIKNALIDLNKLNVFIGENGTGKTIAAYAIFSFASWLKFRYVPSILKEKDIETLIKGKNITHTEQNLQKYFYQNIPKEFNEMSIEHPEYFNDFFQNEEVFTDKSSITINENDVRAFLIPNIRKHGWYFSWNYQGLVSQTDENASSIDSNENNDGQLFNEILSTYNVESESVETAFLVNGIGTMSQVDPHSRGEQLEALKETKGMKRAVESVNRGLKNILFDCENVYLPAERIGINVFRSYLNLTRLNKGINSLVQGSDTSSEIQLEKYARPIENYISFLNNQLKNPKFSFNSNFFLSEFWRTRNPRNKDIGKLMHRLVPGNFEYNSEKDAIQYHLPKSEDTVNFELLSSSLKSIYGLNLFVKNNNIGDWLFCDEPEMNLHPKNQVVVAELLYELARSGFKLLLSTHSDYFIKAFINFVLEDRIDKDEFSQNINVYEFKSNSNNVKKLDNIFNVDAGVDSFDDTTNRINARYYDLLEKLDEE